MTKLFGVLYAALTALILGLAPIPSANAAPAMAGSGNLVREATPALTTDVQWRGHRGWRGRGYYRPVRVYRPARFYRPYRPVYYRPYRPYRPAYYRPYVRPVVYGPRCFWRPARQVWTPYGWRFRPAVRVCRW